MISLTGLVILTTSLRVNAQNLPLTPEKQALIQEIMVLTNAKQTTTQLVAVMMAQTEKDLPQILETTFKSNPNLSGENLQQANQLASRILKRYTALLPQRLNLVQEIEQIQSAIFAKYYTEAELKDLITFYQSPTGKKVIAIMPQVMRESMQQSTERLMPKQMQLLQEIIQQEVGKFQPRPR